MTLQGNYKFILRVSLSYCTAITSRKQLIFKKHEKGEILQVARAARLARAQRAPPPPPPPPLPLRADTGVAASASGPVSLQLRARTHLWCPIRIIVSYIIYLSTYSFLFLLCLCAGASLKCVCLLSCAYLFWI